MQVPHTNHSLPPLQLPVYADSSLLSLLIDSTEDSHYGSIISISMGVTICVISIRGSIITISTMPITIIITITTMGITITTIPTTYTPTTTTIPPTPTTTYTPNPTITTPTITTIT